LPSSFQLTMISIAPFINHLLAQEKWARDKLLPHAGKIACIDVQMWQLRLKVSTDGLLEDIDALATPDVTIRIKPSDLPLMAQHSEKAFSYVKIEGDADFANTMSFLSQNLRWEAESDYLVMWLQFAWFQVYRLSSRRYKKRTRKFRKIWQNIF